MIDIHSHLLPGVDDGSPSFAVSVPVLQRFCDDGVTTVVCTPHLNASKAAEAPIERYREIFAELQRRAPAGIGLQLGWEIMLDTPHVDLTSPVATRYPLARAAAIPRRSRDTAQWAPQPPCWH